VFMLWFQVLCFCLLCYVFVFEQEVAEVTGIFFSVLFARSRRKSEFAPVEIGLFIFYRVTLPGLFQLS